MSRQSRNKIITSFFHVMTQGINKSYMFEKEQEIKHYIDIMYKINNKYNVKIIAYCIMNNHAHLLLKVQAIEDLSGFMHNLNTQYAIFYNKRNNRVGYVFRDRYKSQGIYTEKQLYNCISYIFYNPVKAGICKKPENYPYSNYKESKFNIAEPQVEEDFIEIDEEKKSTSQIIKEYLNGEDIKCIINNKEELKKITTYLKLKKGISYRKIEKELGIGREKLRKLLME